VAEYAMMMEGAGDISFTKNGDREVVKYNFSTRCDHHVMTM
jgi:hypothetical protein